MPLPRTPNTNTVPDGTTRQDIIQYFTTSTYNSNDDGYEWSYLIRSLSAANDSQLTQIYNKNFKSVIDQHLENYFNTQSLSQQAKQRISDYFANPQNYGG